MSVQDLFDVSEIDFTTKEGGSNADFFSPKPANGINNKYEAIIRFIPWLADKPNSIVTKYTCYLENPVDGSKKTVDSLRSIGKDSECKLVQTFFTCHNSKDATIHEARKMFIQKPRHWALIQVLEDKAHPENVGKILIWQFGFGVKQKFDKEKAGSSSIRGRDPLSINEGRPFAIDVVLKGGHNNYDGCHFVSESDLSDVPMFLDGDKNEIDITKSKDLERYAEYLQQASPSLERFKFQDWDDETKEYVDKIINDVLNKRNSGRIAHDITLGEEDDTPAPTRSGKVSKSKKAAASIDLEEDLEKSKKASAVDEINLDDDFDDSDFDDDFDDDDF